MLDPDAVTWPITNTLVHTRGTTADVRVHDLGGATAITIVFGGAADVTIHCRTLTEAVTLGDKLNTALAKAIARATEAP